MAVRQIDKQKKVIFFNPHPVQYFTPLYKLMNKDESFNITVLYGSREGLDESKDEEFNTKVKWDIDLTEGYDGGIPVKFIKDRNKGMLSMEAEYNNESIFPVSE